MAWNSHTQTGRVCQPPAPGQWESTAGAKRGEEVAQSRRHATPTSQSELKVII